MTAFYHYYMNLAQYFRDAAISFSDPIQWWERRYYMRRYREVLENLRLFRLEHGKA